MKKRHHGKMHDGAYAGMDSRRKLEHEDGGMISEDHSAVANMPQEVMMKPWPMSYGAQGLEGLNDTISGIDKQMGEDGRDMHKFRSKSKY